MKSIAKIAVGVTMCCAMAPSAWGQGWVEPLEPPEPPNYLRASIELGLVLGVGTAWYWIEKDKQVADWDFPSWRERLSTDVLRYDNNPFLINHSLHAISGTWFHWVPRSNNIEFWRSVGFGFASSVAWEYLFEYREKVSINDLIFTTGSGMALGEFFHLFGRYLQEDEDAADWHALRWAFGLPEALHGVLDGRRSRGDSGIWHRFELGYGFASGKVDRSDMAVNDETHQLHSLSASAELVNIPGYLQQGVWGQAFNQGNLASFSMDVTRGSGGSSTDVYSDLFLAGWHQQQIHAPRFLSVATTYGLAMGYRYRREKLGAWRDRLGVLHLPGLAGNLHLFKGDFQFEGRLRVHGDFAGINAMSNEDWNAAHPDEQGKAILRKQGYYYGWGASALLSASLRWRNLSAGAELWAAHYISDEGLDRTQEDVTLDVASTDDVLDTAAWLRLGLPWHTYLGVRYSQQERDATLGEFEATQKLRRFVLQLGTEF